MATWKKRGTAETVEDVVRQNTGLAIEDFLHPPEAKFIGGMQEAAGRISQAIASNEPITIFGDYDADGVTSTAILYTMLEALGSKDTTVLLPRRFTDGYGVSENSVANIHSGLLITIDNGIAAIDAIRAAKAKGLSVVVIDHHLMRDDGALPDADVLVDPAVVPGSDFSGYCGAGLAYKLAELMLDSEDLLGRLITLAAIGTVADVVPLIGDNRRIVMEGLKNLNSGHTLPGLTVLLEALNLYTVTAEDIAFKIGPILNAAGRMEDTGAMLAYSLLTGTWSGARSIAPKLISLNELRKANVAEGVERCQQLIAANCLFGDSPLILYTTKEDSRQLFEGIVGILAGKLAEQYNVPTIVLTEAKPGVLKGSGRSAGGIHMKALLDSVSDTLLGYGGHAGAVGLSIAKDRVNEFQDAIQQKLEELPVAECEAADDLYDLEISAEDIASTVEELRRFAPFGEGNPPISFRINGVRLTPKAGKVYTLMGSEGQHIKLFSQPCDIVGFDLAGRYREDGEPAFLNLLCTLSDHFFNGNTTVQAQLKDFERSKSATNPSRLGDLLAKRMAASGLL